MSVYQSTGLVASLYSALPAIFAGGAIFLYGDQQPSNADKATTSAPLARITTGGGDWSSDNTAAGLHLIADGRFVIKDPAEDWHLVGLAVGTARWWRFLPGSNNSSLRIDGSCGLAGVDAVADMYLPDLSITDTTNIQVSSWVLSVPPLT